MKLVWREVDNPNSTVFTWVRARGVWLVPRGGEWYVEDSEYKKLVGPLPTLEAAKLAAELLFE